MRSSRAWRGTSSSTPRWGRRTATPSWPRTGGSSSSARRSPPAQQLVVCEGRATGTAGLYRADGEARTGLIDEIVHEIDLAQLVFEAPRKDQQAWLISRFGGSVNLGNVPPAEVISLESLRLGLRADTLTAFHARP